MNFRSEYLKITSPNTSGKRAFEKIKFGLKNPLIQFGIFGIIMIAFMLLSKVGVIPVATVDAIGYVLIYSMSSIGFCLLLGYSGLASLGTAGFIGIGALLTHYSLESWGATIIPTVLILGVVAIVLGCVIGFVSLRIEGIYLAILTLCMSEVIVRLLKALEGSTVGVSPENISFFKVDSIPYEGIYVMIVVVLTALLIFVANIIKSPTGRAMLAMKSSTSAAQAMGISLMKYRLLAFVIATLFATISGFFYMIFLKKMLFTTSTVITLSMSLNILGAVIIGGFKSLWGTLGGTFFVFGLQSIILKDVAFFQENPAISVLVTGALMIIIVMFFPGGFAEIILRIRLFIYKMIQKWRVRRYGIEG